MNIFMEYLEQAETLNKKYASIYFNIELEALTLQLLTWEEIQKG